MSARPIHTAGADPVDALLAVLASMKPTVTPAMQPASCTLLTVTVPARAGKAFTLGIAGDLLKSTDGACIEAHAKTVRMQSVQDLAELLGEMRAGQMLLSGVASKEQNQVVVKDARSGSTLSRDAESFPHQSGIQQ